MITVCGQPALFSGFPMQYGTAEGTYCMGEPSELDRELSRSTDYPADAS